MERTSATTPAEPRPVAPAPFSPLDLAQFSGQPCEACCSAGWLLAHNTEEDRDEIQRCDACERFGHVDGDDQATAFVANGFTVLLAECLRQRNSLRLADSAVMELRAENDRLRNAQSAFMAWLNGCAAGRAKAGDFDGSRVYASIHDKAFAALAASVEVA